MNTHLTVRRAASAPAGTVTLVEGHTNQVVVAQDLSGGPLVIDVRPGFYVLKRQGSRDQIIRVAWESVDAEY
jgi:hypothetical protein